MSHHCFDFSNIYWQECQDQQIFLQNINRKNECTYDSLCYKKRASGRPFSDLDKKLRPKRSYLYLT